MSVLHANAAAYTDVALVNIEREFPNGMRHTMRSPDDILPRPRERTTRSPPGTTRPRGAGRSSAKFR